MIYPYQNNLPDLSSSARMAANATVLGNVSLEAESNIWFGAVLRGDAAPIRIGEGSNVQDNVVIHCDTDYPVSVGKNVTIGHGAIIHGCTVQDNCLIGMGAILLNGCVIGTGSLVAAGALVTQGAVIPPNSLVMGSPAKVVRPLRPTESEDILNSAKEYRHHSVQQLPLASTVQQEV